MRTVTSQGKMFHQIASNEAIGESLGGENFVNQSPTPGMQEQLDANPEMKRFVDEKMSIAVQTALKVAMLKRDEMKVRDSIEQDRFYKCLKIFNSLKPDTFDGEGEASKISKWFTHLERLMPNVLCTEIEQVRLAYLQFRGIASEWWNSTDLTERPDLTWRMFRERMMARFFSESLRMMKRK